MSEVVLSEEQRDALVSIVIRGMLRGEPGPEHEALAEAGLLLVKGTIMMPTPAGTLSSTHNRMVRADAPQRERVTSTFHRFLPVNRQLRDLCTAWQVRPDGSVNDHADEGYDADIRDRLDDIDTTVGALLKRFAEDVPRLGAYRGRLTEALEKLDEGGDEWLAAPTIDSYHTVWMHLHQELLLTLGMSRKEDEELEERLVSGAGA